jgi:hypothetical protein
MTPATPSTSRCQRASSRFGPCRAKSRHAAISTARRADSAQAAPNEPAELKEPAALDEPAALIEPAALDEPTALIEPAALDEPTALIEPAALDEPTEI